MESLHSGKHHHYSEAKSEKSFRRSKSFLKKIVLSRKNFKRFCGNLLIEKTLNISKLFAADVIKIRSQTLLWDWYNEEFDAYNSKAVNDKLMKKLMNG
jgi:hypothetical protein